MEIDRWLASSEALGVALTVVLLLVGRANRGFLRDVATDPDPPWRVIPRLALVASALLIGWVSVVDNWRQLIGLPYRLSQRFPSQRVEYDPPSDTVRAITLVLLALSLLFVACLVARHVGGYVIQIVLLIGTLVFWTPLFALRQRFNVNLALGFEGNATDPLDVVGYLLWVVMAWLFEIVTLLLSYGALLAAVALPVTLLLDLMRLRRPRTSTEAAAFFASFAGRTGSGSRAGRG